MGLVESTMQLIDGKGEFCAIKFKDFCKEVEISYVVSSMGPQCGGKSTLLNHLFDTNFRTMNAAKGRNRTTRGIWVALSGNEPCTLVMDLEGTNGRERGENDTNFEKWSALFALAMSNIVLINMWCHDVRRENAANKPLLRTVFQVMLRICSPPRKVTLMFVLHDKTKTPLNKLREHIQKDMKEIWDSIDSPRVRKGTPLNEFFNVEVEALSHYELQRDQFKKEAAGLKEKICGVHRDQSNGVTASVFSEKGEEIWKVIKDDRNLNRPPFKDRNLNSPPFKVLAANNRCDEIAKEKLERFTEDYDQAKKGSGRSIHSLRKTYLLECDEETRHYDKDVRSEKRKELKAMLRLHPKKEGTDFDRNRGEPATAALNVVGVLGATGIVGVLIAIGIAAAALAIPGMKPLAVAMIPVIAGAVSKIADKLSTRGGIKERE